MPEVAAEDVPRAKPRVNESYLINKSFIVYYTRSVMKPRGRLQPRMSSSLLLFFMLIAITVMLG